MFKTKKRACLEESRTWSPGGVHAVTESTVLTFSRRLHPGLVILTGHKVLLATISHLVSSDHSLHKKISQLQNTNESSSKSVRRRIFEQANQLCQAMPGPSLIDLK